MRISPPRRPRSAATTQAAAVFLDKDGTLVVDVPYNVDPARLAYTPHAVEALSLLEAAGYVPIVVSNQPGLALGLFELPALQRLEQALFDGLAAEGVALTGFHACPHAPANDGSTQCRCRKPAPGLLLEAATRYDIDLRRSWMVGDILDDIEAGHRAGCRTVLLDVGNETRWERSALRSPSFHASDLLDAAKAILAADGRPLAGATTARAIHESSEHR